ncbi:MAG: NAD-dependent deacylase [Bacteriovoracaceae bacterium]|nr:NAD-dependent deacylase [Bacteriovoracaceae bacterium]
MASHYKNIVILTGAGISAESGISTFRDSNGLWENHDVMEVASPQGFSANPSLVYRFYNERKKQLQSIEVKPNLAHEALVELQSKLPGNVTIVTQNVDDLHERSGSRDVIHMHGELLKSRCLKTEQIFKTLGDIDELSICECCQTPGNLRPHIVWFGEIPMFMNQIESLLHEADLFLSIGTSGQVYPASMFVQIAKLGNECKTVEVNVEETAVSWNFDEKVQGPAGETVPVIVENILKGHF